MARKLEISVNIVFSKPLSTEESVYDVVTRDMAIKEIYKDIKRRVEDNISEFSRCTPIISHKMKEFKK